MADLIKKIKIKKQDGTFTDYIPIGAEASNVSTEDGLSVENKLKKKPYYFDTVADMKMATYLKNGDMAITLGYYAPDDKGGAKYRIVNSINNEYWQETLSNSKKANLLIQDWATPQQFGAYGDNEHDDTTAFVNINKFASKILIPNGEYLVNHVNFLANKKIEGDNSILHCKLETQALVGFGSNSCIENLTIDCLNDDKEWNRIDLRNKSFITFKNCTFKGFRQQTLTPGAAGLNVWALYLRECHDIQVINCGFSDNNFQDILIEFECYNLYFENCYGLDANQEGIICDIEPSQSQENYNMTFVNCIFHRFETYEYYNGNKSNKNIIIMGCKINEFQYKGGNCTVIGCTIKKFKQNSFLPNAGNLELINSVNFSNQLLKDPYFGTLSLNNANSYWTVAYSKNAWYSDSAIAKLDSDGRYLHLNPNNTISTNIQIISEPIYCSEGDTFLLKTCLSPYYPSTGAIGPTSQHIRVRFYNDSDEIIETWECKIASGATDTIFPFSVEDIIITPVTGATYFRIVLSNGKGDTSFGCKFKYCTLYKIYLSNDWDIETTNNLPLIETPNQISWYSDANITTSGNYINHFPGDKQYYINPTTYLGKICIGDGDRNNNWKNFGAIE